MRITIRVYPGAHRTHVGGRYGTDEPAILTVRVNATAVGGRANRAVAAALAQAFDVPEAAVRIRVGNTHRTKIVDINGATLERLDQLLDARNGT
jgi:uncharacterized protein YggU (UPF0235/DUF167 family)